VVDAVELDRLAGALDPWTGPLWVPVIFQCTTASSPCSAIEMTSIRMSGTAAKVSSK
jgi:hypothetical protein